MEKNWKITAILVLGAVLSTIVLAKNNNTAVYAAQTRVCSLLHSFYDLLVYIASGAAAVMIVVMGVMWITSAENSKARTTAKNGIIHVVIGLLIVSLALTLVNIALPEAAPCIEGW